MAKKSKNGVRPESFLNEAEKILRGAVEGRKNLVVWRGRYPHKEGWGEDQRTIHKETILAGMPDDNNPSGPPGIIVVSVDLDGSARIRFHTGSSDDFSSSVPFGGGHNPLDDVREAARKLSNLVL